MSKKMDNLNEDTRIVYFETVEKDEQVIEGSDENYVATFKDFVFSKELKNKVFKEIAKAVGNNLFSPYIVLIPKNYFPRNVKNITYPILFLGHKLYIVPWIRKVEIYEQN